MGHRLLARVNKLAERLHLANAETDSGVQEAEARLLARARVEVNRILQLAAEGRRFTTDPRGIVHFRDGTTEDLNAPPPTR